MPSQPQDWSLTGKAESPRTDLPRVLVVGAGMAGLTAAAMLTASGFPVTVFEARERLGGRVWTDRRLGGPCDFGGSWIHGADANPLTNWCANLGIPLLYADPDTRTFYHHGEGISLSAALQRAWRGVAAATVSIQTRRAIQRLAPRQANRPATSIGAALLPLLDAAWLPLFDRQVLSWVLAVSEGVEGAPADLVNLENWYPAEAGAVNAMPTGGYGCLIEDVAQGVTVHTRTPVRAVTRTATGVRLHLDAPVAAGETQTTEIAGEVAVIALPLAMLQSGQVRFDPPLPAAKQAAIERIGYGGRGVLNKLLLRFPTRFWPPGRTRFSSLPEQPARRGYFTSWTALDKSAGAPILMGFTNGQTAADLDRHADLDTVIAYGMAALRRIFGPSVPDPVDAYFTRWLSDPWAQGSYSFTSIYTRPGDRTTYLAPVEERIYFCGEAGLERHYGTVHAALLTGAQAAEAIFARYTGLAPKTRGLIFQR